MKILIWFACIFANALITVLLKSCGVLLGGIPTAILGFVTFSSAFALCKKWDTHRQNKEPKPERRRLGTRFLERFQTGNSEHIKAETIVQQRTSTKSQKSADAFRREHTENSAVPKHPLVRQNKWCHLCGAELCLEDNFCNSCGTRQTHDGYEKQQTKSVEPVEGASSHNVAVQPRQIARVQTKRKIVAISMVAVLVVGSTIGIYSHIIRNRYYDVMLSLTAIDSVTSLENISRDLNRLPTWFRDVGEIKSQLHTVMKMANAIPIPDWSANHFDVQQAYKFRKKFPFTDKDCNAVRKAYETLYEFDEKYERWDLSELLDTSLERAQENYVYGREWACQNPITSATYYFQWNDGADGQSLRVTLPNEKNSSNDYYFFTEGDPADGEYLCFGYEPIPKEGAQSETQEDARFIAYRVTSIAFDGREWEMTVYCYKNGKIYNMK